MADALRKLPITEENIKLICGKFGIECSMVSNVISLKTSAGYWRIYIKDDKVDSIHHGNYRMTRTDFYKKKKKYNEGLHEQNVSVENFYDVVKYIYCHDRDMLKNKKNRIDKLFEQIERERD
ncbi:MAG: hypothetical protein ACI4TA_13650 [Acetatifactor sp.]